MGRREKKQPQITPMKKDEPQINAGRASRGTRMKSASVMPEPCFPYPSKKKKFERNRPPARRRALHPRAREARPR